MTHIQASRREGKAVICLPYLFFYFFTYPFARSVMCNIAHTIGYVCCRYVALRSDAN